MPIWKTVLYRVLRRGLRGGDVAELQAMLNTWANSAQLKVDAMFGPSTEGAVKKFQMVESLVVDGEVGPVSWGVIAAGPQEGDGPEAPDELPALDLPPALDAMLGRFLSIVDADVGAKESGSSNNGPEIAHLVVGYNVQPHLLIPGIDRSPWCLIALMVWSGMALELGMTGATMDWARHPVDGKWLGSIATQLVPWARAAGVLVEVDPSQPAPVGAWFAMVREGSGSDQGGGSTAAHCGVVTADDGDWFYSTDGNVSNKVKRCHRKKTDVDYWVLWYDAQGVAELLAAAG